MRKILAFFLLFLSATAAWAQDAPKIGLVLGGGGAKGFAHVGVLQVLEEHRIPVHMVAGTSMGAVVGSLYASGRDANGIALVAQEIDWATIFNDAIPRERQPFRRKRDQRDILISYRVSFDDKGLVLPKGVLRGQDLFLTLAETLANARTVDDFDRLATPFRAVATDIVTGEGVVMGQGDIATAVFASMAVPGGLPPVERDGRLLVDGMIANNVPVDVARSMGADVVIVVDVSAPLRKRENINSFLAVIDQMQLLLGRETVDRQLQSLSGRDVLVKPDIDDLGATDFDKADLGIARGRAAALAVIDRLKPLALSPQDWAAFVAARAARAPHSKPTLDFVKIDNRSDTPTEQIAALVTARAGQRLDAPRMTEDLRNIYALGSFRAVRYGIGPAPGSPAGAEGVTILALGDPSSANFIQFGLGIATDFDRQSDLRIGLAYTDRNVLGTGAEWRSDLRIGSDLLAETSLYKQWGHHFLEFGPGWSRVDTNIYEDGTALAEVRNERLGVRLEGGQLFGNWGELRLGLNYAAVGLETKIGQPAFPDNQLQDAQWSLMFTADTLDRVHFPTRGAYGRVRVTDHMRALGGDFTYAVVDGTLLKPFTFGLTTVTLSSEFGFTSEGDGRSMGDFRLGGFLNLSGLQPNQLLGRHRLMGRAIIYRRLSYPAPIVDFPLYLGGSLEMGNAWMSLDDIGFDALRPAGSLFISTETPLGPVTMAAGLARGGGALYLVVGRLF